MALLDIAVEIGTSNTAIYLSGNGIVIHEPTIVAFRGEPSINKVLAVGASAHVMLGKTPERTVVIKPVVDGIIVDPVSATCMLKEFIKKIIPVGMYFFPRIRALLCIPTGLTASERKMYETICLKAGIAEVTMIESILATAVGMDLPIVSANGGVVVNIGGGSTEIASLSIGGIVAGCSINIGGEMMDNALLDYLTGKYNIKLGDNTIRQLKIDIGSLYTNDTSRRTVNGIDTKTRGLASVDILATDIAKCLRPYYDRIVESIQSVINTCPPELASDIYRVGIHVTGGSSMILGLEDLFSDKLRLSVSLPKDPQFSSIIGAGKLLANKLLLNEIIAQN